MSTNTASAAEDPVITIDGSHTPADINSVKLSLCHEYAAAAGECGMPDWHRDEVCVKDLPHDGSSHEVGPMYHGDFLLASTYTSSDCTGAEAKSDTVYYDGTTEKFWLQLDSIDGSTPPPWSQG